METTIGIGRFVVGQRGGGIPLDKHIRMPRPARYPDVVDCDAESWLDAAEALKPAAKGFFAVALTTKRVGAGNAVMNMRRDCFCRLIPSMVVNVVEGLLDFCLNNVAV